MNSGPSKANVSPLDTTLKFIPKGMALLVDGDGKVVGFVDYRPPGLHEWIALCRQARRWTQEQLAELLEVDPMTLSRWERAMQDVTAARKLQLEELFGERSP